MKKTKPQCYRCGYIVGLHWHLNQWVCNHCIDELGIRREIKKEAP